MAADLVLIPVQPSPYDVWAAQEVVTLIQEARIYRKNLKYVFKINSKIVNTAIGRDLGEALSTYETTVLKASISQRVIFAEAAAVGKAVFELEPNSAASKEISALINEILEQ